MGKSAAERANSILREAAIRYARMKVDKVGQKGVLGPDGDKYRDRAIVGDHAILRLFPLTYVVPSLQANPDKIPEECWKGQREKYEELLNAAEEKGSDDDSDEEKDTEEVKDSEEEDDDEKPKVRCGPHGCLFAWSSILPFACRRSSPSSARHPASQRPCPQRRPLARILVRARRMSTTGPNWRQRWR